MYILPLDTNFADFLSEDARWQKQAAALPHRGLTNDADDVPAGTRRTAQQRAYMLERSTSNRVCPLCKQFGRSNFLHFLSGCTPLQEEDQCYMAKVRQVINLLDDEDEQNSLEPEVSNTEVVGSEVVPLP